MSYEKSEAFLSQYEYIIDFLRGESKILSKTA